MSSHIKVKCQIKTTTKEVTFGIKTITNEANFGIKTNFDGFLAHLAIRGMAGICFCALTALMASHRCWALSESEFLRTSRTILDSTAKASVATVTVFAVVNVANMIFQALIHTFKNWFWGQKNFCLYLFFVKRVSCCPARASRLLFEGIFKFF